MSKTCTLRLFTWTCELKMGQAEVAPVCPIHHESRARFGRFGTGIIVICEVGTHLIRLCEAETFEAESEEARGKLISQSEAATA
jgi:hypothetical protein